MIMKRKNCYRIFSVFLLFILCFTGCKGNTANSTETQGNIVDLNETQEFVIQDNTTNENKASVACDVDYSDISNWAYFENEAGNKKADVFFICPTVYKGAEEVYQMAMDDEDVKSKFLGATNMEKGIYDENARFFAPYYKQVGLNVYSLDISEREQYLSAAYIDVKAAFEYYINNCNDGRPIVFAGFSQGADMCIRLMKEYSTNENIMNRVVACYAIGWSITSDEMKAYPKLKFAQGENDTGVIVSFNSEAEYVDDSLTIPKGTKTLAINPLNWKTDGTVADKSMNLGACFTNYSGGIKKEIPELTGAYIDSERGALKVTDVTAEQYPPVLTGLQNGVYHLYDYQFFYRNLQKNVNVRINAFTE